MAIIDSYKLLSDEQLVMQYQQRQEQQLLATLYLRYSDLVYGVCVKYLKDQDAAKDAVMTIYEELCQKLHKHKVDNFKSWLYVLSKNFCLMQLRKEKKMPSIELSESFMQLDEKQHLENVLLKEANLNRMEKCMDLLNEEQQKTIRLFYLEEKCYNEITEITGLEWNKVRSLIQNGKRNLKLCMDKHEQQ